MKVLRGLLVFVVLVFTLDRVVGRAFERLYFKIDSGESGGLINRALARKSDVLLLGSSRMKHHVQPSVLKEQLGMSVYNAGINGQDFLYAVMLMDAWMQTNPPPKMIILHVDQASFVRNETELRRAQVFSYYLDRSPMVREILCGDRWIETVKYWSLSYRANGKVLSILKNALSHSDPRSDGFEGLTGDLSQAHELPVLTPSKNQLDFWPQKVIWFDRLAEYCRAHQVRLVLITSPRYLEDVALDARWKSDLRKHLEQFPQVEFLDLTQNRFPALFANKPQLFQDNSHLNQRGATIFSELLASELKAQRSTSQAAAASSSADFKP